MLYFNFRENIFFPTSMFDIAKAKDLRSFFIMLKSMSVLFDSLKFLSIFFREIINIFDKVG